MPHHYHPPGAVGKAKPPRTLVPAPLQAVGCTAPWFLHRDGWV